MKIEHGFKYKMKYAPNNVDIYLWRHGVMQSGLVYYISGETGDIMRSGTGGVSMFSKNDIDQFSLALEDFQEPNTWGGYINRQGFKYVDEFESITIMPHEDVLSLRRNIALRDYLVHLYPLQESLDEWVDVEKMPQSWKNGSPVCFRSVGKRPFSGNPQKNHYHFSIGYFINSGHISRDEKDLGNWSFEEDGFDADSCDKAMKIKLPANE